MTKKITYLSVSAYKEELMPNDTIEKVNDFLKQMGLYITNLEVSLNMRDIDEGEPADTPDTSTYTEQAYPAPAEEPEQPKEEPEEEPKEEPAPVPKDVTKDELKAALREYRDRFGWEALHELYDRFGNGATKLVDLEQGQYAPMYAGAQEKLGDA